MKIPRKTLENGLLKAIRAVAAFIAVTASIAVAAFRAVAGFIALEAVRAVGSFRAVF